MKSTPATELWKRFKLHYREFDGCRLALDLSRMNFAEGFFAEMQPRMVRALAAMRDLEGGAVANPDEKRMVGHYWLRHPDLAPGDLGESIRTAIRKIKAFAAEVHSGAMAGQGGRFEHLLVIGIGGSALGPQLVASALGRPGADRLKVHFFDNTDPDGMDRALAPLVAAGALGRTLALVVSKSGSTPETRNGMLEAEAAWASAGLCFARHAVAVTQLDDKSALFVRSRDQRWLRQFPMWDWVGGRTSETSAVGLLPAALQGLDIDGLLAGAKACDEATRRPEIEANPAALMALAWYHAGGGHGKKDLVILPYKDRLELFSKYLQQLIMESLGKELDLDGKVVNQGLAVYGNKGSTDQHAYVQQLREGVNNFFATFIEVLRDRDPGAPSLVVDAEKGATSGDYLHGFLLGTRTALFEKGRESLTLTIPEVNAFTLGALIALFERTVGLYAALIHVNAYHQPGVEAGKKAAGKVLELQRALADFLAAKAGNGFTADELAAALNRPDDAESIFKILTHLAANPPSGVRRAAGHTPTEARFYR